MGRSARPSGVLYFTPMSETKRNLSDDSAMDRNGSELPRRANALSRPIALATNKPVTASSSGVPSERPHPQDQRGDRPQKQTMWEKLESFIAVVHAKQLLAPRGVADLPAVCVQVRHQDGQRPNAQHSYILPFRRFNKNW